MSDERTRRVAEAARLSGAGAAILTSLDTVCYATGHETPIEAGPSPFAGGPTTAVVSADGIAGLVVTNLEEPAARAGYAEFVRAYEGFGWQEQAPLGDNYLRAVAAVVDDLGVGGVVAIEPRTTPTTLRRLLEDSGVRVVDVDPALTRLRATKTPEELLLLRRCAEVTSVGQRTALEAVREGRPELEVFADVRCAMELAEGRRLPLTGDLMSGPERTAAAMGWPSDRRLQAGDPVICDLAPRVAGYWGDSCNTLVVGEPTPALLELHEAARRAFEHAVETLRPGIAASAFDAGVRGVITSSGFENPLHIGHGIGTSSHEFPRLVPRESALLAPDMVLMVEPGAYRAGVGGVRLEWMFRVTETGNEVLSSFEHALRRPERVA